MKLGRLLALGTLVCGAYYAYKRREDIKEEILDLNQSRENISHDLDRIIKQDLSYKTRVFQKDLEPRLSIIQERLKKYQSDDNEKGKQPRATYLYC